MFRQKAEGFDQFRRNRAEFDRIRQGSARRFVTEMDKAAPKWIK